MTGVLTLRFCREPECSYRTEHGFVTYKCATYWHRVEELIYMPIDDPAEAELAQARQVATDALALAEELVDHVPEPFQRESYRLEVEKLRALNPPTGRES